MSAVLTLDGLTVSLPPGADRPHAMKDVSLTVGAGEIVGIAGLVGAGRTEVLETVYGARRRTAGRVLAAGRELPAGSVPAAVRAGLGLAPEERKSQALLLGEPVPAAEARRVHPAQRH